MTGTIRLHRVLRAPAEVVYKAFLLPEAMVKWLPPHGFTGKVHELRPVVDGTFRMSFANLRTGKEHSFGGRYLELVPGRRLRYTDVFDDPALPGRMTTTVTLTPVGCGTDVQITQEGVPDMIPVEMCYLGWQESLTLLARLVEADIPD